ncbi:ArnT family glycosyltransferase [Rubidibacter lacunae]|uniref:ArnT family glycosyltransferase n=1 Tax=Rubidibacter lacunae TaxID=582514 RepID=UPI000418B589|nr:glycosyltransferase family 39 protein [Rubidibacter lacunae]
MSTAIFSISLGLRLNEIEIPLNIDEVKWIERGAFFLNSIINLEFAKTYISHHPGVTNSWSIGISLLGSCWLERFFADWHHPELLAHISSCLNIDEPEIGIYIAPRLLQAFVTSTCLVGMHVLARQLIGPLPALIGTGLLVTEPFFVAYQRYISTDALQASFSILALLMLLLYLRGDRTRRALLISGTFAGLAVATKITALFALPAVIHWLILIEQGKLEPRFPTIGWQQRCRELSFWGATGLVTVIAIWPATWVRPLSVIKNLLTDLLDEADRGSLFFFGHTTDAPNPLFYPLVLIYRLSPVLQIGILICLICLIFVPLRKKVPNFVEVYAIALVPFWVLVLMSIPDSKIDRYIHFVTPELALLAGTGWSILVQSIGQTFQSAILGTILAVQLAFTTYLSPYNITFFNPVFGGARTAQNILTIGQGEGLEKVAGWLNNQPDSKEILVASWYRDALATYFRGRTSEINRFYLEDAFWLNVNYIVLYQNQLQRQLPDPDLLAYISSQKPVYTVRFDGINYALVYPGPVPTSDRLESLAVRPAVSLGTQVELIGYGPSLFEVDKSNNRIPVTLYWRFASPLPANALIRLELRDRSGEVVYRMDSPLVGGYLSPERVMPGTTIQDIQHLDIPDSIPSGHYYLSIGWIDGDRLLKFSNMVSLNRLEIVKIEGALK